MQKAETDERLVRALSELSSLEESRIMDLSDSTAESETGLLTAALAKAKSEMETVLLASEDKIGCLTVALNESKKKIEMISSEIEGLREKLGHAEAQNLSLASALGESGGKVEMLLSESENKISSLTVALTESRSTIESLSQAVEISERKASCLHTSLEQSKTDNNEKAVVISELQRIQTEIDAQLKLSKNGADKSPVSKSPRSATKLSLAGKKKTIQANGEETKDKGSSSQDGLPGCLPLHISDKEFSHMQGEMRRFRYARDEAKVSMSKMAGRVAILKDQLQEKVNLLLLQSLSQETDQKPALFYTRMTNYFCTSV